MIRLGCYEFIVCKGNVFKRIRKTKTHACLCCRAAVSFCNVALHLHLVIRLCANWAAVRQPVQALHGVIPASEPESWAASCVVLHCAIAGDAARNVSTMPPPAPRFWFAYAPIGRRFGIPCKHLLPSFRPPSGNPGRPYAGYWATLIAIPVSILAIASQDAGSVAGMTAQRGRGRKERAGKGVAPFCIAPRTSTLSFACAPIGRRFGIPCKHLLPSFRPPSRNPGRPLCGVLRCTAASLLSIPANASQDPVSEHGVTGREENAGTKGCYTKNRRKRFRRDKSLWLAAV